LSKSNISDNVRRYAMFWPVILSTNRTIDIIV
jgi:hypothetical protein